MPHNFIVRCCICCILDGLWGEFTQPSLQGSTVSMTGNQFLINVSKLTRLRNSKTCNVYYTYYMIYMCIYIELTSCSLLWFLKHLKHICPCQRHLCRDMFTLGLTGKNFSARIRCKQSRCVSNQGNKRTCKLMISQHAPFYTDIT